MFAGYETGRTDPVLAAIRAEAESVPAWQGTAAAQPAVRASSAATTSTHGLPI
jgi:hypothetical protein